jgi:hypothetical protein
MVLRPATVLLLTAGLATAQIPTSPLLPPVGQPVPGAAAEQDPDKAKPKTPEQMAAELEAEKQRLLREIRYVQDRGKNQKRLLAEKLAGKPQSFRSIDAGSNRPAPTAVPAAAPTTAPQLARVATPEELANHPNDTLLVVNGRAVSQRAFDELMQWLADSPGQPDEKMRAQRATYELIRTEVFASHFPDSDVEERMAHVEAQLAAGKSMTDLAKSIGTIAGAAPGGVVNITRNSAFGPRLEIAAFATEVGKRARPFRHLHGLVLLQVDSAEKGTPPAPDRLTGTVVLVPYTSDGVAIQKVHAAMNTGQVDILVRDQAALEMLPTFFTRHVAPVPFTETPAGKLIAEVAQIDADIAKLLEKGDDESKQKAVAMRAKAVELRKQLEAQGIDVGDAPDVAPGPRKEEPKKEAPKKEEKTGG